MAIRKFIAASPRQNVAPRAGEAPAPYIAVDNDRLGYAGQSMYPILNVMNGYIEEGDLIELLVITADYPSCIQNLKQMETMAMELCRMLGASCKVIPIDVAFSEFSEDHLVIFEKLIEHIKDGDRLSACITFGSKPTPLLEIMALNYGYRTCNDVTIECIAYGEMDHATKTKKIYDVTSLFLMDQIVNDLGQYGHKNALGVIKGLLAEDR